LHFKSEIMKWNAIISKSQYEKALKRASEISNSLPGSSDNDELRLLQILIKDYEDMHNFSFSTPQGILLNLPGRSLA
jgi:muramidase (phage lysozyme)